MTELLSSERFALRYEPASHRRVIAGKDVIIHCHHYNSRVQRTLEGADMIDGRSILRSSAEAVFAEQVRDACRPEDDEAARLAVVAGLYARLGFGRLDLSRLPTDRVIATSSHYVEGWLAGFGGREQPTCAFTEGYLQGAIEAATGRLVYVRERACMAKGDPTCEFDVDTTRTEALADNAKRPIAFTATADAERERSANVDEGKIIDALVEMPIYGNDEGLIPAFGVYLANTPADYYNQVAIRFVEAMSDQRRARAAKRMLVADGETCAMNTFRGIMNSAEWEGLVAPMIVEPRDKIFALVAISNGLGWGNWHIVSHPSPAQISYESVNGYEALGHLEYRGESRDPTCYMLTGVAAGLLELVYGTGTIEERLGTCATEELGCICQSEPTCRFLVERDA